MKSVFFPLCALTMALAGAGAAMATPITTTGLTVTSGDLIFGDFTCAFSGSGHHLGGCSSIDVAALTPLPTGIQFSTDLAVKGISSADAALTFFVDDPGGVNAVGLSFNSIFFGMDVNSVTENVYASLGGPLVGTATVTCGDGPGCLATTTDNISLNGTYPSLYITKDINLSSFNEGASGSTSIITQTFSGTSTPEPVSLSLMGGGLALIGLVGVRKSKSH